MKRATPWTSMVVDAHCQCIECGETWDAEVADIDLWCDTILAHRATHGPITPEVRSALDGYRAVLHLRAVRHELRQRKGLS